MKNILKSLFVIVAVAMVASGATFAIWGDSVEISGVTVSSGTADLRVANQVHSTGYHSGPVVSLDDFTGPGYYYNIFRYDEEPFYPGKEVSKSVYLANFSTAKIDLEPTMQITSWTGSESLKNDLEMKADWSGNGTGTGWHDVDYFISNKIYVLDSPLQWHESPGYPNNAKYVYVRLRMKSDATTQGADAGFNVLFDATQVVD